MATTTTRSDIRTRVRDYLYEDSADWFTDNMLNRAIVEEINSLPSKDIYRESVYTTNLVANQMEYTFPTTNKKCEKIQINNGTDDVPDWGDFTGWDSFNNALYLAFRPSKADTIRAFLKLPFTPPTDDVTVLDVPDDVCEIVVWGTVLRCYRRVIGYLRQAKNWDAVSKPDYLTVGTITGWIIEAQKNYNDLIKNYMTVSKPRDIDLTS